MEKTQKQNTINADKGFVTVLWVTIFAFVITVFFAQLIPLCKRIITQIEIRHAVDVATMQGIHTEVEILNNVTSMNHLLMVLYGAIAASALSPTSWGAIPKLIDAAKFIAKLQDAAVMAAPALVAVTIIAEKWRWNDLWIVPTRLPRIKSERGPSLLGIPAPLELEDDYEDELKVSAFGWKVYDRKLFIANAEGEPEGEDLLHRKWRTKPLQ